MIHRLLKPLLVLFLLFACILFLLKINSGLLRNEWYPPAEILKEIAHEDYSVESNCQQSLEEMQLVMEYQKLSILEHKYKGDMNLPEVKEAVERYSELAEDFYKKKGVECYIAAGLREKRKFISIFHDLIRDYNDAGIEFDEFLLKNRESETFVQMVSHSGVFIYEAERTGLLYEKPLEATFIAGILFEYRWISWIKEIEKPETYLHKNEYVSLLKWKLLANRTLSDERREEIRLELESIISSR